MIATDYNRLLVAAGMSRQSGRTRAICEAAKKIGATVICANGGSAMTLRDTYGVETVCMTDMNKIEGSRGPYLFDHLAVERLISGLLLRPIDGVTA